MLLGGQPLGFVHHQKKTARNCGPSFFCYFNRKWKYASQLFRLLMRIVAGFAVGRFQQHRAVGAFGRGKEGVGLGHPVGRIALFGCGGGH